VRQALTVWDRLDAWGRWCRSGDPLHIARTQKEFDAGARPYPPTVLPAYALYSPYRAAIEEGGEVPPLDPPRDPIDESDAMYMDYIYRVAIHHRHRHTLYKHFYRLHNMERLYIDAAVRAVTDAIACDLRPSAAMIEHDEPELQPYGSMHRARKAAA